MTDDKTIDGQGVDNPRDGNILQENALPAGSDKGETAQKALAAGQGPDNPRDGN